ncbi:hypothetical protein RHMOL_Rhmol11G0245900 [Rhododendron molle]|uniref:Uncharacterized protein n=1 Tax=Rhododendron molle TaxID=49168 RepID=A0ACC0LX19_RHOML|nr:hypothetical protein RHMOL_Rhmol11G0245900 [Rhododendron molle]
MLPTEKIQFIIELGGLLESKNCGKDKIYAPLYSVFDNIGLLIKENYHLKWLAYANELRGFKKPHGSSYSEPPKDPHRETRSISWRKDQISTGLTTQHSTAMDLELEHFGGVASALGIQSVEELQLIFEMLFPNHVGQLRQMYDSLKRAHDENTKLQEWDETLEKTLVIERVIAKDRPPTWSEMTLEKEIELLKLKGLEDDEECENKKKRLEHEKQVLNDSIYKALSKAPH